MEISRQEEIKIFKCDCWKLATYFSIKTHNRDQAGLGHFVSAVCLNHQSNEVRDEHRGES